MFTINKNTALIKSFKEYSGVNKVAEMVRKDLSLVFDSTIKNNGETAVIYGTIGQGGLVDALVSAGKLDISEIKDKWEVYSLKVIDNPFSDVLPENGVLDCSIKSDSIENDSEAILKGIKRALVVAGSNKRGTIYGLFRISELCGVSPLVNWSGVLPKVVDEVVIDDSALTISKEPSVKYRGIFINDEWPAFGTWATERFGGVNAECYAEIFEMILRLKGNYMWPAMWATNISLDGPGTKAVELADELGIVMSTSHHEPCMRTGEEYSMMRGPQSPYGDAWDFLSNREGITRFWEDGLKRNGKFENVITMGMRGERDTAIMAEATLADNIALLKDVIRTQNDLIRKNVNEDLTKVPRQIVLFTEVEKFYYGDENTPGLIEDPELDGITIMFSDNNYGYTRTLPSEKMLNHPGGYGMYYHVDMHGGAYSYEWIGSTYLPRIQDQLTTTYDYGVREIWVVNVGDIVSQELEISFIMDMAYDMEKYGKDNLNCTENYTKAWIERQFGSSFDAEAKEKIFDVLTTYTKILERRKHEIMNETVYHPVHFGELDELGELSARVLSECDELLKLCPKRMKTGFYELVYYPAVGTCNLMTAWVASTKNRFYINQNRNTANSWNDIIDKCIEKDEQLIDEFHKIGDGKFYGQALSEHFNFRFWNDNNNQLPLKVFCYPANKKRMLVSKTDESWFSTGREYTQTNYTINDFLRPDVNKISLEISCASKESTQYRIECDVQWLEFSKTEGITDKTDIITVMIDRKKLGDKGQAIVKIWGDPDICSTLTFNANSEEYVRELVYADQADDAKTYEAQADDAKKLKTYIGFTGYTVVEAEHYSDKTVSALEKADIEDRTKAAGKEAHYECLRPYGITGSGMKLYPNTLDATLISEKPYLEYNVYAFEDGEYEAQFVFAPSTPVTDILDQSFGVSVNGGEISRVNTVVDLSRPFHNSLQWVLEAKAGAKRTNCKIDLKKGRNIIRYYQLSPNLIFERFVVAKDIKAVPESYLGPTESYCVK